MDPYEPEVMRHVRYALLEGWHVYRVKCRNCDHDWPAALEPGSKAGLLKCQCCGTHGGVRYWKMEPFEVL